MANVTNATLKLLIKKTGRHALGRGAEYLDEGHTSTQPNKVIELLPHKKRTRRS
jgi:hypothetical protein